MSTAFEHGWFRFLVASLLLATYGAVEWASRLAQEQPPRVRRPVWSHLLGFASLASFYGLIGSDGGSMLGGLANRIGVILCLLAMAWRFFFTRSGTSLFHHPDLVARLFFFSALPLVVGSPKSWLWFTLPQWVIAAYTARQRDASGSPSA